MLKENLNSIFIKNIKNVESYYELLEDSNYLLKMVHYLEKQW